MVREKIRDITITELKGVFDIFKRQDSPKENYDFEGLQALRQILNNEKARILHVIKTKNPGSIYALAKELGRHFKTVSDDLKLLERFGFIEFREEQTKKRARRRPVLTADTITIHVKV